MHFPDINDAEHLFYMYITLSKYSYWASLVAQRLKSLPGMRETWVRSLGQEDPLEKEMAPHSSTLAWRNPWSVEPGSYSPWGHKESDTTERLHSLNHLKIQLFKNILTCNGCITAIVSELINT